MSNPKSVKAKCVREPVGNLCILRDETLSGWEVLECKGIAGDRKPLGRFSTRSEAEAFAHTELARLNSKPGPRVYILHVDDCPCWQKEL